MKNNDFFFEQYVEGRVEDAEAEGEARGRAEGEAHGEARGEARGRAEEKKTGVNKLKTLLFSKGFSESEVNEYVREFAAM